MSRIGKQPLPLPDKVTAELTAGQLKVSGPKGELTSPIPEGITCQQKDNELVFTRTSDAGQVRAFHGLARALA